MVKVWATAMVYRDVRQSKCVEVEFETTAESGDIHEQIKDAARKEADNADFDWDLDDIEVSDLWDVDIED